MKAWRHILLMVALMLPRALFAVGGPLDDDYQVTIYTVDDGLPENSILAIQQSADGYLWAASYGGLVRFDGLRFTVFDPSNTPELSGTGGVYMLNTDKSGSLWIVTDDWRVTRLRNGLFQRFSGQDGLPDLPMSFMGDPFDGHVYLAHSPPNNEVYVLEQGKFAREKMPSPFSLGASNPVAIDQLGFPWRREGGKPERIDWRKLGSELPSVNGTNSVRVTHESRSGGFWVASGWGLFLWRNGKWDKQLKSPIPITSSTMMREDKSGNVWIATWNQGLWRIDPSGKFHLYTGTAGKPFPAVRALFEDAEGNMWVGTEGIGLLRVKRRYCDVIDPSHGLSGETIRSITSDQEDRVWTLTQKGLDCIDTKAGNRVSHLTDIYLAWSIYCDSQDQIWVGSYSGELWKWDHGALQSFQGPNVLPAITCLSEDDQKNLWVGTANGLWVMTNQTLKSFPVPVLAEHDIKSIAHDNDKTYLGTSRAGLWQLKAAQWRQFPKGDISDARTVFPTTAGLYIGSQKQGLWRTEGEQLIRCCPGSDLPRQISCLVEDDMGWLWCGSAQGIFRVPLNQLGESNATVDRYGKTDGLPTSECTVGHQPTVCKTSDGRLWFATSGGVAVLDPSALTTNAVRPPVVIESAQVFGYPSSNITQMEFTVPPGKNRFEIHYTAMSFSSPERVRFKYRLDGLDHDWTDAGTRRVAYYQGLDPGHYEFHVIACNNNGLWNEDGASLAFTVQPWFWQSTIFKCAVALLILTGLWMAYHVRLAQVASVNNLRLRISRDLHDEIGANLGSIGLNVQLLLSDHAVNEQSRRDLAGIDQLTRQTQQAARDIVWMTNPDFDNVDGMIARMRELAALMLAGRKWSFEVPQDNLNDPLRLELRRNLFFAFKECLHNIVKHSEATSVSIILSISGDMMDLEVKDNGRGFDPSAKATGTGLRNLHRRVAELGGAMTVATEPGRGAQIHLRVPVERQWQWRKFMRITKSREWKRE